MMSHCPSGTPETSPAIVRKIVEAMKGKVWCESVLGQGALFILELPLAKSPSAA